MAHKYHKSKLEGQGGESHTPRRMASIRIDTADDPDRYERIAQKLKRRGSNMSVYGRELFAALERYIDTHDGHLPQIPLQVGPEEGTPKA